MNKENTAIRLKKIMEERGLRQIDILNLTIPYCKKLDVKMNKSDISQYVSGKVEPNQDKLYVLGLALGVNEAWLMGYDVSMNRKDFTPESAENDFLLIEKFSLLTEHNKTLVMDLIETLLQNH